MHRLGRLAFLDRIRASDVKTLDYTTAGGMPLPRNYFAGLLTTRANGQDITIAVGECRDSTNIANILVTSSITKMIDADWAEGSGQGGFPDTALNLTADTTYHVFVLGKVDGSGYDAGFDTSTSASNLLGDAGVQAAGYGVARRVWSVIMDSGPTATLPYTQVGNHCLLTTPVSTNVATPTDDTAADVALGGLPLGISVMAEMAVTLEEPTANLTGLTITSPQTTAAAADSTGTTGLSHFGHTTSDGAYEAAKMFVRTDLLSSVQIYPNVDAGVLNRVSFAVHGWLDDLGKFD